METEATKELRTIKAAIAAQYKSFREFFVMSRFKRKF